MLDGTVEVIVGDECRQLSKNEIALVPTMVAHDLRNIGNRTARILGFFGSKDIVATFDVAWMPNDSNIVDTAALAETPIEA